MDINAPKRAYTNVIPSMIGVTTTVREIKEERFSVRIRTDADIKKIASKSAHDTSIATRLTMAADVAKRKQARPAHNLLDGTTLLTNE
jgi:hypothetical protein